MSSLSNYLENKLLDHVFTATGLTQPTNIYIALSTANPGEDASGLAEPAGNNYARKAHNTWNAAATRAITNSGAITFNTASGAWGEISHFAIMDAITGGNMLAYGALSVAKNVVANNTPEIASGGISVSWNAGAIGTYLANKLLDHTFKNTAYTRPTIYVALSTANPTDAGTGLTEPSGNNYARIAHAAWAAASGGATSNTGICTFPTPSGSWGTITYMAIMDALTVGNMLFYGTVVNQEPRSGDIVRFPEGDIDVTMD